MTKSEAFEPFQVLRQVPGHLVTDADDPIPRHGGNDADAGHVAHGLR
jgi:hypothetical protein